MMPHSYNLRSIEARALQVTVGNAEGMFRGNDHLAIQGAIDYIARRGGGTVMILPGRYILRNAVQLADSVTLHGAGRETILEKPASNSTALTEDTDGCRWYINVEDSARFAIGDGITITSRGIDENAALQHSLHTIVEIEGNRLHLDSLPAMAHWANPEAAVKVASIHSLIEARHCRNIAIKNLALQGNADSNQALDGNYGAAIFMRYTENAVISGVTVTNYNGDGISWQTCHDVVVEDCDVADCRALGLHPGNGSQRPVMRNNKISRCKYGIYWCWDVNYGVAQNNHIYDCTDYGITIGHRDTDNVIRANTVIGCHQAGIFFRPERTPDKTAHRTLVEGNTIECLAQHGEACGISVTRGVEDTVLRHNVIRIAESKRGNAIVIDPAAVRTVVKNNQIITTTQSEIKEITCSAANS